MRLRLLLLIAAAALVPSANAGRTELVPAASFPASGEVVWQTVAVRARPDPKARAIVAVRQFRSDFRPQYLLALGAAVDEQGDIWYRVSIPRRPNGTVGWVPAAALDARPTDRRVVVHRDSRTLQVREDGRVVFRTRVAVGKPGAETPLDIVA